MKAFTNNPHLAIAKRSSGLLLFLILMACAAGAQEMKVSKGKMIPLPGLLRGPYLQVATSNSIVIRWRTDALTRSRVRYGLAPDELSDIADDSAFVTEHKIKLTGLAPRTKYYYSIGAFQDTLKAGEDHYFVTLPTPGEKGSYKIGVFGDCGTNNTDQRSVRDEFVKYLGKNHLDAWILLGDNAYKNGTDAQYQSNFFNIYEDHLLNKFPLFPAPGNHDYGNIDFPSSAVPQRFNDIPYYHIFSVPTKGESGGVASQSQSFYSFDVGNVHFISLDSYGIQENGYKMYDTLSAQAQWLKRDLEANNNKDWVVAYWHHPPYSMGSHNSDNEADLVQIRTDFIPILERNGVDLVLCGHSHLYERSGFMRGHYGPERTFDPAVHNVSPSSGHYNGEDNSCPYIKDSSRNTGTVYVVSGSAGKVSRTQASYPHDAMVYSDATTTGAAIVEVEGNRLDVKWICSDGVIRDQFTMMKDVNRVIRKEVKRGTELTLTASYTGTYRWSGRKETSRSIQVKPPVGTTLYTVSDEYKCVQDTFEISVVR